MKYYKLKFKFGNKQDWIKLGIYKESIKPIKIAKELIKNKTATKVIVQETEEMIIYEEEAK